MGEKGENKSPFKRLIKPTSGKIVIWALLMVLLSFLPLYPTHVHYSFTGNLTSGCSEYNSTRPFIVVLVGEFQWIETWDYQGISIEGTIHHKEWECNANPIYSIIFFISFALLYLAGCLMYLYIKVKLVKGVKDYD